MSRSGKTDIDLGLSNYVVVERVCLPPTSEGQVERT